MDLSKDLDSLNYELLLNRLRFIDLARKRRGKKAFLKILQNSPENTCAKASFFNEVAGLGLQLC